MATAVKGWDDFRAKHDKSFTVPRGIQTGLAELGPEGWEYEQEFVRKHCKCSNTEFARHREAFMDFAASIEGGKKRVWCGSKQLAKKIRESQGE